MIPTKILMFMMMSELMDSLLGRCFFNDLQKTYMSTFLCSKADV